MSSPDLPASDPLARAEAASATAIRRRLMARVADTDGSHRAVGLDDGEWLTFVDGVRIKTFCAVRCPMRARC